MQPRLLKRRIRLNHISFFEQVYPGMEIGFHYDDDRMTLTTKYAASDYGLPLELPGNWICQ